nr:tetratricopeptide repeat protein [uncultured Pseudodesulfovibrio sp.]
MILAFLTMFPMGCMSTMAERQGTKAYIIKDYTTAQLKYQEAADQGNTNAMYHLAVMYAEGQGIEQNYPKAAGLLDQAVIEGNDDARLMLGLFNIYGDGVPQNPAKGATLIATAADNGNDIAMYYLANLFAAGLGVEKSLDKAEYWMQEAKSAGFPVRDELLTKDGLTALYEE